MDVCVFTITCNEIADAILAAHKRGVRVRIITDDDQSKTRGSDVEELARAGIPVRHLWNGSLDRWNTCTRIALLQIQSFSRRDFILHSHD